MRRKIVVFIIAACTLALTLCGCGDKMVEKTLEKATFQVPDSFVQKDHKTDKYNYITDYGWKIETVNYETEEGDRYLIASYSDYKNQDYDDQVRIAETTAADLGQRVTKETLTVSGCDATLLTCEDPEKQTMYTLMIDAPDGVYKFSSGEKTFFDTINITITREI